MALVPHPASSNAQTWSIRLAGSVTTNPLSFNMKCLRLVVSTLADLWQVCSIGCPAEMIISVFQIFGNRI